MSPATVEKPRLRNSSGQFSARGLLTAMLLRKAYGKVAPAERMFHANLEDKVISFDASQAYPEKVDKVNAVIRGVSVITGGLVARGHDLEVDDRTLEQIKLCADSRGQVPVKVDHKSGAAAVCGYLTNFHLLGNKLKADWHLLQSHPQKDQILETAEKMPSCVGLSAAFVGPDKPEKSKSGKQAARCTELLSVDYVALPAANPSGMFSAKVDSPADAMNPEILAAITEAVNKALAPVTQKIDAQAKQLALISNPPSIEDLAQMDEKALADLGLTPADVQEALEELAQTEGEGEGEGEGQEAGELVAAGSGEGEASAGEGSAAPAAGSTAAALAALTKQVTELSAKLKAKEDAEKQSEEETLLSSIEQKVVALSEENARLKEAVKAGGQPAAPGVDRNGVVFFSREKNKGDFEKLVQLGIEEKKLNKAKAFEFARKENPAAYDNYLIRLGVKAAAAE